MDPGLITLFPQLRRPFEGNRSGLVNLINRLTPTGLMGDLIVHGAESVVADDLRRAKVLKLRRVRSHFRRKADELFRPRQLPIVVRSDVRDEIGRVISANSPVLDLDLAHSFSCLSSCSQIAEVCL